MKNFIPTNGYQFTIYVLMLIAITVSSIQAIYIHDTGVLLDAKDKRIDALTQAVDHHQAQAINARNDATFQRDRCDAFYDVVGDYVDVTNQIKQLNN
jgi:hypothetical protein